MSASNEFLNNFEVSDVYQLIKMIHTIISVAFLIIAVWLLVRSVQGIRKDNPYTGFDKFLSYGFIINLYLQLIFGLFLFSNHGSAIDHDYSNVEGTLKMASNRFWPIEHIVLMLFALFIANMGLVFSNKSLLSKEKHKKILIYYAIAIIMITISLSAI